jgi:UDP-glucuronate decarboxylase
MQKFLSEFILTDSHNIFINVDFKEITNKSITITGASGLVGHYLVSTLNNAAKNGIKPSEVILIIKNELPKYFYDLVSDLNYKIIQGDLTDVDFLLNIPNTDYIIHGAGYGQPGKFMSDKIKTIDLNTLTTKHLLLKLNENGKFLFLSTSEVYSGLSNPPFLESQIGTTNTNHPRSCYIEGKRCGEAIVNSFRLNGVNAKSARLSLAYGPGTRTDDKRVINNFIEKGLKLREINLLDHGTAFRTYIYITDAVELMYKILFLGSEDIYNIGGKSRLTIYELANKIGNQLNAEVKIPENQEAIIGAPDEVYLDMTNSEKKLDKHEYVDIDKGIENTIYWQKKLFNI